MTWLEYFHVAILISAMLNAFVSMVSIDNTALTRISVGIVAIVYGAMWTFFVWIPLSIGANDIFMILALLSSLSLVAIGMWTLLVSLLPYVNVMFAFATLSLMQVSRLRLYVQGARYDYCGWHPTLWALQTGILVALIITYSRLRRASSVAKKAK